jgi:hypothetical protein
MTASRRPGLYDETPAPGGLGCWSEVGRPMPNPQRTCVVLVDAEMPGDGMDVQEPKDQQHDSNQADDA